MTNNHISAGAEPEKTQFVVLEIQVQSCVRCLASGLQGQRWTMHLMVVANTMDLLRYLEIPEALQVFLHLLAGVRVESKVQVASVVGKHVSLTQMSMAVAVGRKSEVQEDDGVALSLMCLRVACSLYLQLHLLAFHRGHP